MIEISQQVARGTSRAVPMYKVYRTNGDQREYLGWFGRGKFAKFNPYREYTDSDRMAIMAAINNYNFAHGYPEITRYGSHGLTQAQIEGLLAQVKGTNESWENDDE